MVIHNKAELLKESLVHPWTTELFIKGINRSLTYQKESGFMTYYSVCDKPDILFSRFFRGSHSSLKIDKAECEDNLASVVLDIHTHPTNPIEAFSEIKNMTGLPIEDNLSVNDILYLYNTVLKNLEVGKIISFHSQMEKKLKKVSNEHRKSFDFFNPIGIKIIPYDDDISLFTFFQIKALPMQNRFKKNETINPGTIKLTTIEFYNAQKKFNKDGLNAIIENYSKSELLIPLSIENKYIDLACAKYKNNNKVNSITRYFITK